MEHYTSMQKIDGEWRRVLVVVTDAPTEFAGELRFDAETSEGTITTIYPDAEPLPVKQKDDKYYYWFVYNVSVTLFDNESEALRGAKDNLADAEAAINILMGVAQ